MQPDVTQAPQPLAHDLPPQKHYLATFFLSFMWGIFGADRFYLGYYAYGIAKLLTFGGFGIWAFYDFAMIASGRMKDAHGRELLQIQEYKQLTNRIVTIFTIVLVIGAILVGAATAYALSQIMNVLSANGGLEGMIQEFIMGQSGGLTPEQMQQLQDLQNGTPLN